MKGSGTFHQLVYHFVWGTKTRLPLLTAEVEAALFLYIRNKCREMDYVLFAVNGATDHLHLLLELAPSERVSDVAKLLKGGSAHYINHSTKSNMALFWQDGYAVVTLRKSEIPTVVNYISRQKEHHQSNTLIPLLELPK